MAWAGVRCAPGPQMSPGDGHFPADRAQPSPEEGILETTAMSLWGQGAGGPGRKGPATFGSLGRHGLAWEGTGWHGKWPASILI